MTSPTARSLLAFLAAAAIAIAAALPAQSLPYDTALVVAIGTPPSTIALEIDLQTGSFTVLPPHATDAYPPLAIECDPIDGTTLVALDTGSASQIMRRRWRPTASESLVGTVPGRCIELLIDRFGDVVVVTSGSGGGLHRLPRAGGAPTLIRSEANIGAAGAPQTLHWNAVLGISGTATPPLDPKLGSVDLDAGTWGSGPLTFPGFLPLGITGLIDLPTAMPRQVLAHTDGTMSIYDSFLGGNPLPVGITPTLPAGGIAAMKAHDRLTGLVLGGAANPLLYGFDPLTAISGSIVLTPITGPLLGTPIDYTVRPPAGASVLRFCRPCGIAAELRIAALPGQGPGLGNNTFGLRLRQGLPLLPAWLVLGFGETAFPMPTGCRLRTTLDAIGAAWTDPSGDAALTIPLPNAPGLIGVRFFGQWLQADFGVPFMTSDVAVVEVGI